MSLAKRMKEAGAAIDAPLGLGPAAPEQVESDRDGSSQATSAATSGRSDAAPEPGTGGARRRIAPSSLPHADHPGGESRVDPLRQLKHRTQQALFERLGARLYDASLDQSQIEAFVREEITAIIESERLALNESERSRLIEQIGADVLGHGPIDAFLDDDSVTEVMVSGLNPIYVERQGVLVETDEEFVSIEHLRRVIERIVSRVGRRIDESSPMVDARLPDGSRVNAVIPPLAVDGPSLNIRKFSRTPLSVADLVSYRTLTPRLADFLEACVRARVSILVSGGTGSGKTTMLNVLSSFVTDRERMVTIEDSVELQLRQRHVVRLESRPPNVEGKGEVTIRQLVRNALRMRPDRIIVGEVRGAEALDMLQAMNTGHEGSLTTLHANSPRDALARLETMVLMAGLNLPLRAVREQIASAVQLVVHVTRLPDGTRRLVQISEVAGMEGEVIQLSDIFEFDWDAGVDAQGRYLGVIQPTGLRPSFSKHLHNVGVDLPADMFGDPEQLVNRGSRR